MRTLRGRSAVMLLAAMMAAPGVSSVAHAQTKVGTTAAQFLGIAVGARAIAMGSAYVASMEDVSSLYWNPGSIVQSSRNQISFVNSEWLADTKFRWAGVMLNFDGDNAVGLSFTQLDYGEEEVTTVTSPEGTGERWSAKDLVIGISYSRRLTDRFSVGGTAKYVNQTIYNESASNITFDAGLLFITDFNDLRIGMSMSNFGGDLTLDGRDLLQRVDIDPANPGGPKTLVGKLKTEQWPMPLLFRVGVAMDVVKNDLMKVTAAVDGLRPSDNTESINVGAEVGFRDMFFVRGGYKSLFGAEPPTNKDLQQDGLTFGAGLRYAIPGIATVQVDYAFMKFGLFGNLNTIALAIGF